jgi:acetyl esterase/lipase
LTPIEPACNERRSPGDRDAILCQRDVGKGRILEGRGGFAMKNARPIRTVAAAGLALIVLSAVAAQDSTKQPDANQSRPPAPEVPSERFKLWDRNHDGRLTRDELPEGARANFERADTNGDGFISPEEDRRFVQNAPGPQAKGQMSMPRIPDSVRAELDIAYATTENPRQRLDLYLPKTPGNQRLLPLVVFIHGGAFRAGDKRSGWPMIARLVTSGQYAGASIGYRLSGEVAWPAQIHDCKAAVRWLRANAGKYRIDADRMGVIGTSAGGHLVAMLGTSGNVTELEGMLGDHREVSSRVACVVDEFGPTDFLALYGGHNMSPDTPEAQLIGGSLGGRPEAARSASPITFASADDPTFLVIHGTKAPAVAFNQSERFTAALKKAGVDVTFVRVEGAGHGNFRSPGIPLRVQLFFDKHLRGLNVAIPDDVIESELPRPDGRPERDR